jgi:hypothetical protein
MILAAPQSFKKPCKPSKAQVVRLAFDPDAYLNEGKSSSGFDPDAYLGIAHQEVPFTDRLKQAAIDSIKHIASGSLAGAKEIATMGPTAQKIAANSLPIAGGMALTPLGLAGPGAAAGEFAREAVNTVINPQDVPKTALGRFASTVGAGVMQEPKMLNAIPGVPKVAEMASNMVNKTGKGMAKVFQAISGGKAQDFIETAKKGASTYSAPSLAEAGQKFVEAVKHLPQEMEFVPPENPVPAKAVYGQESKPLLDQFGQVLKKPVEAPDLAWKGPFKTGESMSDTIEAAVTPEASAGNKFLKDVAKRVDDGELITARQALKAKQSLDDVIDTVPIWQTKRRAKLFDIKKTFDDVLSSQSGELKEASDTYRAAVLKNNMTKFLPVNKHGEYSRLAPMLTGLASSVGGTVGGKEGGAKYGALGALTPLAGMVAMSPGTLGGIAAGAGGLARGLNVIGQNPAVRQVLLQVLEKLAQKKQLPDAPQ